MDGSFQTAIAATVLGLAPQIEWGFYCVRIEEALTCRKTWRFPSCRPRKSAFRVKWDQYDHGILIDPAV